MDNRPDLRTWLEINRPTSRQTAQTHSQKMKKRSAWVPVPVSPRRFSAGLFLFRCDLKGRASGRVYCTGTGLG